MSAGEKRRAQRSLTTSCRRVGKGGMNRKRCAVDAEALHARLDGLLPPERMAAVERYLAEHPEEQERWSDYAAQRRELRAALAMPPGEPIPERLRVARLLVESKPAPQGGKPR
jgi:anti-sigma factor RsiW